MQFQLNTQHSRQDVEICGVSLSLLISRAKEKSVTMPSGLTREQRREWAMKVAQVSQA
ncbi:TPA: hypothetical protein PXJ35_004446 [Yersinia enterocolitica]|nr:hypothetical protein [Yersinia enterocolitica]HDL6658099.1 hypothetical protein [Yersinia enterocolitica]HDL6684212.1 hypothetical protein [Yersinia enterocolitica]